MCLGLGASHQLSLLLQIIFSFWLDKFVYKKIATGILLMRKRNNAVIYNIFGLMCSFGGRFNVLLNVPFLSP